LASGDYRRIEDLRTEDFILSAEKSPDLQLADSTVVNISVHNNLVVITFSYDSNRGKVSVRKFIRP
jgi:ataxin 1/1L